MQIAISISAGGARDIDLSVINAGLVASVQPAIIVDHVAGGFLVGPIAQHDARAADLQFVFVTDAGFYILQQATNTGRIIVLFTLMTGLVSVSP